MESVEIEGVAYTSLEDVNKEVAKQLGVEDDFDISMQKEQLNRITDELDTKNVEVEKAKERKELEDFIHRKYSKQLKDVDQFIKLVRSKGITDENDIHDLFKKIPKQAKKGVISRFLY